MNLLGIDFEDWYHPQLIKENLPPGGKLEPKVIQGIDKILDWLRQNDTLATFFVVGELLEYEPELLDKIIENDHEIGFHTMHHNRLDEDDFKGKFSQELDRFTELTQKRSIGFRAPTFSLNNISSWAIDTLEQKKYLYDSSIIPAKTSLYGNPDAEKKPYKISSNSLEKNDENGNLIEFPLLTTTFLGKKIPAAGGFYLRTLPMKVIKNAIKNQEEKQIPSSFYIHSWELTPEFMPRIDLPIKEKFITYHNLEKSMSKMTEIIKKFEFTTFKKYISNLN
ncbi:polysaccharide deacetylase family protein [Candidatus Nitrosopelagicus sp.]|nr:polysaccharide deacetylase family protein [Candidatus Nitrosopelagicus sp.]